MSDRIIRDELLDSPRYLNLTSDSARLLFVHFMLVADDLGNAEAGPIFIRRRLLAAPLADEAIATLLSELYDADLLRVYTVEGKRFVHIPRWRQRLRSYKNAHPRPPAEIECKEIKALFLRLSDKSQSSDGQMSDQCQSPAIEEKGREGKGSEEKKVKGKSAKPSARAASTKPATRLPDDWHLPPEWHQWAVKFGMNERRAWQTGADFKDYWIAKPGPDALKADWEATWRRWVRTTMEKLERSKQ